MAYNRVNQHAERIESSLEINKMASPGPTYSFIRYTYNLIIMCRMLTCTVTLGVRLTQPTCLIEGVYFMRVCCELTTGELT